MIIIWAGGCPIYYYDPLLGDGYYPQAPAYVAPSDADDDLPPLPDDEAAPPSGDVETNYSYAELGNWWAQDLRRDVVQWDDFLKYLATCVVVAPQAAIADFQQGFISAYGPNGAAAFDKAFNQARQNSK